MLKNLPAMQETLVQSQSLEDPLEEAMKTHSSILACRIPWIEEPSGLQSMGVTEGQTRLSDFTFTFHYLHNTLYFFNRWLYFLCYIRSRYLVMSLENIYGNRESTCI